MTDALDPCPRAGADPGRDARLAFSGEVVRQLPKSEPVSWLLRWSLVHRWAQAWWAAHR